jgi:hypothetical protein
MLRTLMISAVSGAALTLSAATFAQQGQFGTPQEAKAMLDKAVVAVKADQPVATTADSGCCDTRETQVSFCRH